VQIVCAQCSQKLTIDDAKVPERPFQLKCPKCGTMTKAPGRAALAAETVVPAPASPAEAAGSEDAPDEAAAPLAPERGARATAEVAPGLRHAVPSRYDCRVCHEGRPVPVLGFTALQLSPDRDRNAPHAERPDRDDVDLRRLVDRGLVRGLAPSLLRNPPRIPARTATERAALGYLYGNCAMCHNARGSLAELGFSLDSPAARRTGDADAVLTAVSRASHFTVPGASGRSERVRPGDPAASAVAVRMGSRRAALQMPPLGTQVVDEEAMRVVRRWIAEDLAERISQRRAAANREEAKR